MQFYELKQLNLLLNKYVAENNIDTGLRLDIQEIINNLEAESNSFKDKRRKLAQQERDATAVLQSTVNKVKREIKELQKKCPHRHTERHPDPSGNNDSWTECKDCGADL